MNRHPLSPGGNTLVILDACVLLPSRLSDVLFDLMLEGLYFAYWTGDVEAEFLRNWPVVHPAAAASGPKRLNAFQRATRHGHLITGYGDAVFMSRVPARVQNNDRHLVAAALVMANGLDEEDDPALHRVLRMWLEITSPDLSKTGHCPMGDVPRQAGYVKSRDEYTDGLRARH